MLYDYEATQSTELSVKEDEILHVYDKDEEWLLVQDPSEEGRVGYVPGNYVEEVRLLPLYMYSRHLIRPFRRTEMRPQPHRQLLRPHCPLSSSRIQ